MWMQIEDYNVADTVWCYLLHRIICKWQIVCVCVQYAVTPHGHTLNNWAGTVISWDQTNTGSRQSSGQREGKTKHSYISHTYSSGLGHHRLHSHRVMSFHVCETRSTAGVVSRLRWNTNVCTLRRIIRFKWLPVKGFILCLLSIFHQDLLKGGFLGGFTVLCG